MLECMQSLGKRQHYFDYEYEFYENFLSNYLEIESEGDLIRVSEVDQKSFSFLEIVYSKSTGVPANERDTNEKLADSLTFFVACGTIKKIDGKYFISKSKLNELAERYEIVNDSYNAKEEKGIAYKKGTSK